VLPKVKGTVSAKAQGHAIINTDVKANIANELSLKSQ
jgi:hypothetical protein